MIIFMKTDRKTDGETRGDGNLPETETHLPDKTTEELIRG